MSVRNTIVLLFAVLITGCATSASQDWTRFDDGSLSAWLKRDAAPQLVQTFTGHPRFKGEKVRVAVMQGERVAESTDGLAVAVRDALYSELLQAPVEVSVVTGPSGCSTMPTTGYYLAVETTPGPRGASIRLRIYDIVEQQWVSGFAHQWHGELSVAQRQAVHKPVLADSARGLRVMPFTAGQSDLLAAHLAAELACQLKRDGDDEQVVLPAQHQSAALIAGNLARSHDINVGVDGALMLDTRVHRVADDLYQIWAILTPRNDSGELSSIVSSAYASAPLLKAGKARQPQPASTAGPLLSRIRVIKPADTGSCNARDPWGHGQVDLGARPVIAGGDCFALQFDRQPRARIFVVNHQVDSGLVRLSPSRCNDDAAATGSTLRVARGSDPLAWDARGGMETFYVLAARSRSAAGRVERLIARLPDACGPSDNHETPTARWLTSLDTALAASGDDVAWQAVRVHHQAGSANRRPGVVTGVNQ